MKQSCGLWRAADTAFHLRWSCGGQASEADGFMFFCLAKKWRGINRQIRTLLRLRNSLIIKDSPRTHQQKQRILLSPKSILRFSADTRFKHQTFSRDWRIQESAPPRRTYGNSYNDMQIRNNRGCPLTSGTLVMKFKIFRGFHNKHRINEVIFV